MITGFTKIKISIRQTWEVGKAVFGSNGSLKSTNSHGNPNINRSISALKIHKNLTVKSKDLAVDEQDTHPVRLGLDEKICQFWMNG